MNWILVYKYVFCSRFGTQKKNNADTLKGDKGKQKRKQSSQIVKCPTKIGFEGGWMHY